MKNKKRPPLILISPDVQAGGAEMADAAISLSNAYQESVLRVGGIPLAMPDTVSPAIIAECVSACDGVLLTGGEDVDPGIYGRKIATNVRDKVTITPDGGRRDYRELLLIDQVFRQGKPLLAICRGHQVLNVALGGTLIIDIPSQIPGALNHRRRDMRREIVHEVRLTPHSLLARITGKQRLGVNSTHHQAIERVAPLLRPTALSPDGVIESLELKPEVSGWLPFLLAVQFHPERLSDRYEEHLAIFKALTQASVL